MGRACVPHAGRQSKEVMRSMAEERPSVRGGIASAALSASAFQKYLGGMDYPAGKQDLISHAKKNNAPDAVIQVLEMFGDKTFQSAAEVSQEFGRVK